jgi:hypothetical protein
MLFKKFKGLEARILAASICLHTAAIIRRVKMVAVVNVWAFIPLGSTQDEFNWDLF